MSYGLRVWDASGALKLNITDRLTCLLKEESKATSGEQWYSFSLPTGHGYSSLYVYALHVSATGDVFSIFGNIYILSGNVYVLSSPSYPVIRVLVFGY